MVLFIHYLIWFSLGRPSHRVASVLSLIVRATAVQKWS